MERIKISEYLKWVGISFLVVSSYIFLGGYHVGPISLRILVSYGLLGYTLWRGKIDYCPTKSIKMYYVYFAFFIFISILNFTAFKFSFIKNLLAYHLVCCTAIFVFPKLFKTEVSLRASYIILVAIFLFNAFVTYLQFINSPLGWEIGIYINPTQIEELEEIQWAINSGEEFKDSILMGVMGTPVGNGYFVTTMLPVMTFFVWDKIGLKTIWAVIMFMIAGICIFMIQQRMSLIVSSLYIFTILVLKKKNAFSIVFFIIAAFVLFELSQSFDVSELGRLGRISETEERMGTLTVLNNFFTDPRQILIGYNRVGTDEDLHVFRTMGHNTFLDTLRRGGIFLMLVYIVLYFRLCRSLVRIAHFSRCVKDHRTLGMAIGCLCYLFYSQTHSTGVQSGGILFWTLFMLTIQSHRVALRSRKCRRREELSTKNGNS